MPRASTASRLKQILLGITRDQWIAFYDLGPIGADKIMGALGTDTTPPGKALVDLPRTAKGLSAWFDRLLGIGSERADSIASQVWQEYEERFGSSDA